MCMYVFVKKCVCHVIFSMIDNVAAWQVCAVKVAPSYNLPFLEYFLSFCNVVRNCCSMCFTMTVFFLICF